MKTVAASTRKSFTLSWVLFSLFLSGLFFFILEPHMGKYDDLYIFNDQYNMEADLQHH